MDADPTGSAAEAILSMVAIRLAALVLLGVILPWLPAESGSRHATGACRGGAAERVAAPVPPPPPAGDEGLRDLLRHD
ncbi:hypothetical protein [Methylobacterium organophilum]|uniref:Uncharacterized protein n=1 Tax=Methylobacterium organophilum TaxID=410 RepID=A0ABQ4TFW6_METOR|nr:hypothetical protein [Methylobacterium organophilum]UMY18425.1 hypothetical protein MMB17_03540 [Methylobacterium organophilum]GJE29020.1 hypothetical protein LKMONMHP_3895 [Methylobacterium organophilum]